MAVERDLVVDRGPKPQRVSRDRVEDGASASSIETKTAPQPKECNNMHALVSSN